MGIRLELKIRIIPFPQNTIYISAIVLKFYTENGSVYTVFVFCIVVHGLSVHTDHTTCDDCSN